MSELETEVDRVLATLEHELEAVLQALHRGEVHEQTARREADRKRAVARRAMLAIVGIEPREAAAGTDPPYASALSPDEVAAITRCVNGWLPMGDPGTALATSRCIPAAREIAPTWGEREMARTAIRRAAAT